MTIYRIALKEYASDLTGTGAMLFGGRWNSKGKRMLYTSQSLSLAALETAVNASRIILKKTFYCVEIELPECEDCIEAEELPKHWNGFPYSYETVRIGDKFIDSGKLGLRVPSAIIEREFNLLINPLSIDFKTVRIKDSRPFLFDSRLKN